MMKMESLGGYRNDNGWIFGVGAATLGGYAKNTENARERKVKVSYLRF